MVRMRNTAIAAAALAGAIALTATGALAQEDTGNDGGGSFYLAPRLNFGISDVSDFRLDNNAQAGTLVQKQEGAEFVAGASLAFGYKWDTEDLPLRIEGQYYYRYHYDLNLRFTPTGGGAAIDYDNETVAHAGLIQGYWHLPTDWGIEPYVGLSLGGIYNRTESDRRNTGGGTEVITTNSFQLAYGGGVGVWWDVTDSLAVDIGYRYLDLTDLDTDRYSSGERVVTSDYHTHDIYVGVAWKF